MSRGAKAAGVAWLITAVYYFYQYTLRSAPAVMMPQLSEAFGLTAMGVASMVGLFYWGYSPFSLVAGAAMDGLGPRRVVPLGAAAVGIGALLFATGGSGAASVGRVLQGAGGVFALVGAVYIASTSFPASRAATLIGATQMFGMAGGSAGQFVVGPLIGAGLPCVLVAALTAVQRATPPHLLGRTTATAQTLLFAPTAVGMALGAALVGAVDLPVLSVAVGAATLLPAAALLRRP